MAPSLPPVMSSNSLASTLRVTMDERTIPEWAFHEAVQSKVSEYLCKEVNMRDGNKNGINHLDLPIGRADIKVGSQDRKRQNVHILRTLISLANKERERESAHLLNNDRPDECFGLHVPNSYVSVLATSIQNILPRDERENGAVSAFDGSDELQPVRQALPDLKPRSPLPVQAG